MSEKLKSNILLYGAAILIPTLTGLLSAFLTRGNMQIYESLELPPFAPPSILFSIVWSILYVLMGISSAIAYKNRDRDPRAAYSGLSSYIISLIFNFCWSIIFFNLGSFLFAFIWLLLLLYFIIRTILSYRRVSKVAAYLQIPYALWVCFAGYLNLAIFILN